MDVSGGRVAQSCQYFQKFVDHYPHKILLLQPLLLPNQAISGNVDIQTHQSKCIEHDWKPNVPVQKIIRTISNQQV